MSLALSNFRLVSLEPHPAFHTQIQAARMERPGQTTRKVVDRARTGVGIISPVTMIK